MNWNLIKRFTLVENYPLYAMVGVASFIAVYTPFKHLTTDFEIVTSPNERDANKKYDAIISNENEYMGGVYGWVHKTYMPYVKSDELNKHRYTN